jgi:hypothetical protein
VRRGRRSPLQNPLLSHQQQLTNSRAAATASCFASGLLLCGAHVQEELRQGEEVARCPSCSLYITVVYNPVCVVLPGVWHVLHSLPAGNRPR